MKFLPEVILRNVNATDQERVFYGLSHPQVIRHYGISFQTFEQTAEQMQWFAQLEEKQTGKWWVITTPDSHFAGMIGCYHFSPVHFSAEWGYWLLPEYMGKGIMYSAAIQALNKIYSIFPLNRLQAEVELENHSSAQLLKKLGFQMEGIKRECEMKNGKFIGLEIYSLLRNEFENSSILLPNE